MVTVMSTDPSTLVALEQFSSIIARQRAVPCDPPDPAMSCMFNRSVHVELTGLFSVRKGLATRGARKAPRAKAK